MTYASGNVYEGGFKNGKPHGRGTYTWTDGNVHKGLFKDGKKHGNGTYAWASGRVYEGLWKNYKRDGNGTFTNAKGDVYEGKWEKGKRHGTLTLKEAGGDIYKLVYNQGELVSRTKFATLINGPASGLSSSGKVIDSVVLNDEDKICSVCFDEFATDTSSSDESIKRRLPVSGNCGHWYCHGCLLDAQAAQAEKSNGVAPEWIKCLGSCTTDDAFCPAEPVYNRLLISFLERSIPIIEKYCDTEDGDKPAATGKQVEALPRASAAPGLPLWSFLLSLSLGILVRVRMFSSTLSLMEDNRGSWYRTKSIQARHNIIIRSYTHSADNHN